VLAHLDELGPVFETGLQPAEWYFGHSILKPQEIEESRWSTVSKAADRSRPIRTVTCLSAAVKTPSRTSSSAVSVKCPFLYAD